MWDGASIEAFLAYLESVRRRTRAVVERIPEEHWDTPSAEGRFTPGDVVRHIAATERWMWAENAQGRPSRYPGHGPELAPTKAEALAYLDQCHEEAVGIFAALTPVDLNGKCRTVGGAELTVWKWLRLMLEHEIHHRGQLYEMLGRLGVALPPLYGLTEREVLARSEPS